MRREKLDRDRVDFFVNYRAYFGVLPVFAQTYCRYQKICRQNLRLPICRKKSKNAFSGKSGTAGAVRVMFNFVRFFVRSFPLIRMTCLSRAPFTCDVTKKQLQLFRIFLGTAKKRKISNFTS